MVSGILYWFMLGSIVFVILGGLYIVHANSDFILRLFGALIALAEVSSFMLDY
jgi:hypothetical protein